MFLRSETGNTSNGDTQGGAAQLSYSYDTRRFSWSAQLEHFDRDFQMDTAFYNRTGFTSGWSFGEINFYPKEGSDFWIRRVHPFYFAKLGHDEVQNGDEDVLNTGIRFHFTRQGYAEISHVEGHSAWIGQRFQTGKDIQFYSEGQILRWLSVNGGYGIGPDIFYDPVNPFQGRNRNGSFGFTLQPNQHFSQRLDVTMVKFDRESTGLRVFDVNIVNSRTTYQFDKHFLVRLLEQFDSASRRLLTDLLASYELVPGTVFHAGYGSLYEQRALTPEAVGPNGFGNRYVTVNRGLFFKASYLHRF